MGHICTKNVVKTIKAKRPLSKPPNIYQISNTDPFLGINYGIVETVRTSWSGIKDKPLIAGQIFVTILKQKPELKEVFKLTYVPIDVLPQIPRFQQHAEKFAHFLCKIINCRKQERMIALAYANGAKHAHMKNSLKIAIDPVFWQLFVKATIHHIEKASTQVTDKISIRTAWYSLLTRIVLKMKLAYYREIERQQQH